MPAPLQQIDQIIRALDRFSEWAGRLVAWLIFSRFVFGFQIRVVDAEIANGV